MLSAMCEKPFVFLIRLCLYGGHWTSVKVKLRH